MRWKQVVLCLLLGLIASLTSTLVKGEDAVQPPPTPAATPAAPPVVAPDPQPAQGDPPAPAGENADDAAAAPPNAQANAEIARLNTLKTLGALTWHDARFHYRTLLELGSYEPPAPKNPANRVFLLQDKTPQWAGGWFLLRQGAAGSGFELYDETGKRLNTVVLARTAISAELNAEAVRLAQNPAQGTADVWELVRLAWNPQGAKRFALYSAPNVPLPVQPIAPLPGEFPPLLLRTFPVRASNFDNFDKSPVNVEFMRMRLYDPRAVSRGPVGKRFMIDDRDNPFGNLNSHDFYASTYDGYLNVAVAGRYQFFLDADEYAILLVDAMFPLDADGMAAAHGSVWRSLLAKMPPSQIRRASRATQGKLAFRWEHPLEFDLSAGLHRLSLLHAEVAGEQGVRLAWQLPDEARPHLIAPDNFQSILPATVVGGQARSSSDEKAGGAFLDALEVTLIERLILQGDAHNKLARLRVAWRCAPTGTAGSAVAPPTWRAVSKTGELALQGGQPAAAAYFCLPLGVPSYVAADWPAAANASALPAPRHWLCAVTIPDDLSDQGYLREEVRLAVATETTFAYPGEDWTLHLSADREYGDLVDPQLHVLLSRPDGQPWDLDPATAQLCIDGKPARWSPFPGCATLPLPWNGPTRTPVRLDLRPDLLLAALPAGAGTEVVITVWIEASGVPLDYQQWMFQAPFTLEPAIPAAKGLDRQAASGRAEAGSLVARRDHWELANRTNSLSSKKPGTAPIALLLPSFSALTAHNIRVVQVLGREDPAVHRRSVLTGPLARTLSPVQPDAVLLVGDFLTAAPDLKRLAEASALPRPALSAAIRPGGTPAVGQLDPFISGPGGAALTLAERSRRKQWMTLSLEEVIRYSLRPWPPAAGSSEGERTGGSVLTDSSDIFGEVVAPAEAPAGVTLAIAAALSGLEPLAGGNGLAIVSLGPRDCDSRLAREQIVRGLDATIDILRRLGYPRIVVVGVTPVAGDGSFTTAAADALNDALSLLCLKHGVRYVDALAELRAVDPQLQSLFRDPGGERIYHPYPAKAGLDRLRDAILQGE